MAYEIAVMYSQGEPPEPFMGYDPIVEELAGFLSEMKNEALDVYAKQGVKIYGAKALELCTLSYADDNRQAYFYIKCAHCVKLSSYQ